MGGWFSLFILSNLCQKKGEAFYFNKYFDVIDWNVRKNKKFPGWSNECQKEIDYYCDKKSLI